MRVNYKKSIGNDPIDYLTSCNLYANFFPEFHKNKINVGQILSGKS